jgi:hypothetical protein
MAEEKSQMYVVQLPFEHDGKRHEPGAKVRLPPSVASPAVAVGALASPDKPTPDDPAA